MLEREPLHELELLERVGGELVHGDDRCEAEVPHDRDVPCQVGGPCLDLVRSAVEAAAVVLERADRRDEDDRAGPEAADPAGDVEELLHAHVRAEARLGHEVVAELQPHAVGDEGVVAVRDVRERATVDEGRLPLERLDEVRLDHLLEEDRHRARSLEVLRGDRLARERLADRDAPEPLAQVVEIARHGDEPHHLARRSDVEAGLTRVAVHPSAEAGDDVAQRAIVHVHAPPPGDRQRIDAQLVPVQEVRVDERREQVVRGRDRMEVPRQMEVEVLHRHHLGVAAARSAALDSEDGPERRLANGENCSSTEHAETLRQRDGRRRLAFTGRRRRDRGDVDDLSVGAIGEPVEDAEVDLRLVTAIVLELVGLDAGLRGDVGDRPQRCGLGDLEARAHGPVPPR